MSKKKKIILLIIIGLFFVLLFTMWDKIVLKSKLYFRCNDEISHNFSFDTVYIKKEKKLISVYYEISKHIDAENKNDLFLIYNETFDVIFNESNKYNNYTVDIVFKYNKNTEFAFLNIDNTKNTEIFCQNNNITIDDIALYCPKTTSIKINQMNYNDIKSFLEFDNLKLFWCINDSIELEEEEYILSLFSDCKIFDEND